MLLLGLACTCEETCESIWPPNAVQPGLKKQQSIQVLRNTMDGVTLLVVQESRCQKCQVQQLDCFQFLFYLYPSGKKCLYFPNKLKYQKYRNYRQFATLSQLLLIFHFLSIHRYRSNNIAMHRQFDVLLLPYYFRCRPSVEPSLFYKKGIFSLLGRVLKCDSSRFYTRRLYRLRR